jgi:hypothetical protein
MQNPDPIIEASIEATETTNDMGLRGYPKLAEFMHRNPEVMIFRKFRAAALLNILRIQAELQEMEGELNETITDDLGAKNGVRKILSCDFHAMRTFQKTQSEEEASIQHDLIEEFGKKLHEYRKHTVASALRIGCHAHRCTKQEKLSTTRWLFNNEVRPTPGI